MKGFTRLAGYVGLVLLVGGVSLLLILPGTDRNPPSSLRDDLAWAWVIGYVLIAARLLYLTFQGEGRRSRVLSGLGALVMVIGVPGFHLDRAPAGDHSGARVSRSEAAKPRISKL
jgi:quinol-cytochrome oxidoreductase complex cytochrome b subunit